MGSLDELSFSKKFLYLQVDASGKVIDFNDLFSEHYEITYDDSVCEILQVDDIKDIIALTSSLKSKKSNPLVIRINTNRKDKVHLSMWKIIYIKNCFIALGNQFEEELIFALNHKLRSNSATIEGLMQFRKELDSEEILDMIDLKVKELNSEIAKLMDILTKK
jgi:hypothetical protein